MNVTGSVSGSASGMINIEGDGDKIDVTQVLTEGTKIATITINEGTAEEETIDLYAPEGFSGSWNDLTDKPDLFSGSYGDLTDKPTYNGNTFTGSMFTFDFSTTEKVIGKWIDGKTLYARVFESGLINADTVESQGTVDARYIFPLTVWTTNENKSEVYMPSLISMYNYQGVGTYYGYVLYNTSTHELSLVNQSRANKCYIGAIVCYTKNSDYNS